MCSREEAGIHRGAGLRGNRTTRPLRSILGGSRKKKSSFYFGMAKKWHEPCPRPPRFEMRVSSSEFPLRKQKHALDFGV